MKNSLKVAGWELKKNIKSKLFLIMAFIFPVVIVAIAGIGGYIGSQEGTTPSQMIVGVIDRTGELAGEVEKELTKAGYQTAVLVDEIQAKSKFKEVIEEKDLTGVLVFSADSLAANQVVYYFKDLSDANVGSIEKILTPLFSKKRLQQQGYSYPEQIINLTQETDVISRSVEKKQQGLINFFLPFGLAMMMIIATMISGGMLYQSIVQEKNDRIVEITLSSIESKDFMLGKILGYASLGIIQVIIWLTAGLIAGQFWFDISLQLLVSLKTVYILIYFVLGYFLLASLYAIVGSLMNDNKNGNQVGGLINIIPIVPLYFSQLLMQGGTGPVVKFLTYCPLFTPVTMLLRLGFTTPSKLELISTIGLLLIIDYLLIIVADKVFKTAILMYGQNFSFKKIVELIK